MATLLLIVIYLAFIGLGLPDSLLGTAWPVAHIDLGASISVAGFVSIVATGGTVISSLCAERAIKRFGTGAVTVVSILLTVVGLIGMRFAPNFFVVLLLSVPLGLGGGTVDSALNNYVAIHYKSSHMNWLHCFWGIGATGGPLVMSAYLVTNDWRGAYTTVALVLLGIAGVMALSLPIWKKVTKKSFEESRNEKPIPKRELMKLPGAVYACLAFMAYCSAEYAAGFWASTYFVQIKQVSPDVAASWASMFYFGIMAGRLVSGFVAMKVPERTIMRFGLGLCVLGIIVIMLPLGGIFPVVGLLMLGVGCAPIFPAMLDETPSLFGVKYSQGMIGLQMACAYMGGSLISPLFGWLSPIIGFESWPVYLMLLVGLLIFATEMTQKKVIKRERVK